MKKLLFIHCLLFAIFGLFYLSNIQKIYAACLPDGAVKASDKDGTCCSTHKNPFPLVDTADEGCTNKSTYQCGGNISKNKICSYNGNGAYMPICDSGDLPDGWNNDKSIHCASGLTCFDTHKGLTGLTVQECVNSDLVNPIGNPNCRCTAQNAKSDAPGGNGFTCGSDVSPVFCPSDQVCQDTSKNGKNTGPKCIPIPSCILDGGAGSEDQQCCNPKSKRYPQVGKADGCYDTYTCGGIPNGSVCMDLNDKGNSSCWGKKQLQPGEFETRQPCFNAANGTTCDKSQNTLDGEVYFCRGNEDPTHNELTHLSPAPPAASPPCAEYDTAKGTCKSVFTALSYMSGTGGAKGTSTEPGEFITVLFQYLLGFGGGIALLLIMRAGYTLLASSGKPEAINEGRQQLISAIVGLFFFIFSLIILQAITVDILRIPTSP